MFNEKCLHIFTVNKIVYVKAPLKKNVERLYQTGSVEDQKAGNFTCSCYAQENVDFVRASGAEVPIMSITRH